MRWDRDDKREPSGWRSTMPLIGTLLLFLPLFIAGALINLARMLWHR